MKFDLPNLPADPVLLKQMLMDLLDNLKDKDRLIEQLKHQLAVLQRNHFGRKSEKMDAGQMLLAFAQLQEWVQKIPAEKESSKKPEKTNGHGRQNLPDSLARERVEHSLMESERKCRDCGETLAEIGEETSEQLEYIPSSFYVRQHARIKYACKSCQSNVVLSPMPPQPIDKGLAGPGLLSHVLVSKYCDHLPLNRQSDIFKRHGIALHRSTLCDWVGRSTTLLEAIVQRMKQEILQSQKIHTDDTIVPVLDKNRNTTRKGRLWVYIGDSDHPYTVFDYTPTRGRDGPKNFLEIYKGYLQADAFAGYDCIYALGDVVEVACWAHARRKFFDSKDTDPESAHAALAFIRLLYDVEREAKDMDADERYNLRKENSRPILDQFKDWLQDHQLAILPKSPMGQAISYALSNWEALNRYLENGNLSIDNNASERALKRVVIGRKNWTFAGSDAGGERAAIIYSLIATCKSHGVEPWAYLKDILNRISTHPAKKIHELLPDRWKQIHQSELAPAT